MGRKRVERPKTPEEESEEEKFHVEVITAARLVQVDDETAQWPVQEYLVKWAGYDSDSDSWEPQPNLEECIRLMESFWSDIGLDNKRYSVGFEVKASEEWIAKERKYFWHNFGKEFGMDARTKLQNQNPPQDKDKNKDSKDKISVPAGKAVKTKSKTRKPGWIYVPITDSDDADDKPLVKPGKKGRKPLKRKPVHEPASGSGSDSDQPLRKKSRSESTSKPLAVNKGKDKAPVKPGRSSPVPKAPSSDGVNSLFSAPSSPDVSLSHRKLDDSPQAAPTKLASESSKPTAGSSAGASSSKPPPPAKHLSISHKDRQPKVKALDLPMESARNAISTKARLALGNDPKRPKLTAVTDPIALINQQKAAIRGLSFKKKQHTDTTTPTSATADPRRRPSLFIPDKDMVNSPVSASGGWGKSASPVDNTGGWGAPSANSGWGASPVDDNSGGWNAEASSSGWGMPSSHAEHSSTASHSKHVPLPRRSLNHNLQSPATDVHLADQFLASIMPAELAAPMRETDGQEDVPVAPPSKPAQPKKVAMGKIPKKWKRDCELYMETGPNKTEKVCDVCLTDPTTPRPGGLRLDICYKTDGCLLRFQKFHNMNDVFLLFHACAPIQQYCKVTPQTDDSARNLNAVAAYMARKRQFTYAHVNLLKDPVGFLMVVPTALTGILNFFKVPSEVREENPLVAFLIPWTVTVDEFQDHACFSSRKELSLHGGQLDSDVAQKLAQDRKPLNMFAALGLRFHRFNYQVYDFLFRNPRDYCVWHLSGDGPRDSPGFETRALLAVLDAAKGRNVGYKADVRVIFVHVGALGTFRQLEALGMRRNKQPELRIYSYGTHETVRPDRWGIREIYPIGGVVTFTPLAILQNIFDIYDLIIQIDKHPLWMCYVHPFVIAAVAKLSCGSGDPLKMLESGDCFWSGLLQYIEEGKIALLRCPPTGRDSVAINGQPNPTMEWVAWLWGLPSLSPKDTLAECIRLFDEQCRKTSIKEVASVAEEYLMRDLCEMQVQPAIMDNYRRFVAVTEHRNDSPDKDGIELTTASGFSFKDEYPVKWLLDA